jgi:hypothetical protein
MKKLSHITAILIILTPRTSFAWNFTGHRIIASIAYRQLDDQTKRKIAEVLRKHPAYADLWANRPSNGRDEILNLLWNASVFPDDARSESWRRYGRSLAHYVNYRVLTDKGVRVEAPLRGENILNSYTAHLKTDSGPTGLDRGQGTAPILGVPPGWGHPPAAPRRSEVLEGAARG